MRYNEILQKSAAGELAEKLPTLHKYNYNSIDKLMQHISARHKITGKKLHDLFVHKYGHTPDVWIKKLKSKLGEEGVAEDWSQKYKNSINCSHPKGFSQKAHCAGKQKHNESVETHLMEMVCEDCGMCQTHGDNSRNTLDEACWKGYHKEGNKKMFGKTYPNCVKNESEEVIEEKCPHCNGPMFSEMIMNEKKDACYYKVKSRYKVWPSAYASGALVKCRKKGSANWGNKSESITLEELEESLHDWFTKEKWVRMDTKGNIKGPCAREPGEGKPKCLPQSKAYGLGKKGRASAAARKRREDPNPERSGKAINVNTKKKTNEEQVNEISNEKIQSYLNRADRQVNNRLDRMSQARERLNKDYEIYHAEDPNHPIKYFTANTPEEAKKYYYDYIKKFDSDVDFDLKLRKSTGLTENALKEGVDSSDDIQKIKDFINWSIKQLHIQKPYPKITLSRNTKVAQQGHHTGVHTEDKKIWVYIENRNLIDIFRTIFHELVHERQSQLNMIKDGDSYPGSPIEAMADMVAGKYIKIYGKDHPEIFQ
jgi:hypothetical protein